MCVLPLISLLPCFVLSINNVDDEQSKPAYYVANLDVYKTIN